MTSNIKPDAININFPVANSDNPSQGFRDNFEQIKANLQIAAAEISKLQTTTIKIGGVLQSDTVVLTSNPSGSLVVTSFKPSDLANTIEFPGSGAIKIPSGLTAQRPASAPLPASQGMMRFNTDLKKLEYFNGSRWVSVLDSGNTITGPLAPNSPNLPSNQLLNAQALIIYNLPFIRAQVSAWVVAHYPSGYTLTNAQKNRCARDVGVILACVMNDVLTGGNSNSVAAGNSYWTGTQSVLSYNSAQQKTLTSLALTYTLGLVEDIIGNVTIAPDYATPPLQVVIPSFSGGSVAYTRIASLMRVVQGIIVNGPGQGFANYVCTAPGNFSAQTLVWDNLAFLTSEVVAYVNYAYPPPGYTYDQTKCARDVQLIIACVMNDVLSGITVNSTLAGDRYWNNVTSVLVGTNEVTVTVDALNYLRQLLQKVVANTVITGLYGGGTQVIDTSYTQGGLWADDIVERIDLINDIILNGPVAATYGTTGPTGPSGGPVGPTGEMGPTGPGGGGSNPAGPTQSVQYNDGGNLKGSTGFRYDGTQVIAEQIQVGQVQINDDTITNILDNGVLNLNSKGQIADLKVTTFGGGYTEVPALTIEPPDIVGGVQASGYVSMGAVIATPYNRGLGYLPGDTLLVIGGIYEAPTQLLVDTVRIKRAIVDPANRGIGYKPNDILTVVGGSGPAPATIIITRCSLQNPRIVYTGQGYKSGDTITAFGGQGSSAIVTITTASAIDILGSIASATYSGSGSRSVKIDQYVAPANYYPGAQVWLKTVSNGAITQLTPVQYTVSNADMVSTTITISGALTLFAGDVIYFGYNAFVGDGTTTNFILNTLLNSPDYYDLYVSIDNVTQILGTDYTIQITSKTLPNSSIVDVSELVFVNAVASESVIKTLAGGKAISLTMSVAPNQNSYTVLPNLLANPAVGGGGSGLVVEYDSCVDTVQLQNQGPYYTLPSDVNQSGKYNKASGGSGFGAFFDLTSEINKVTITDTGMYSLLPPLIENQASYPTSGVGTGATINLSYGVVRANATNPGTGYTKTPLVTVDLSPSGNHAKITAIMTGTKVVIGDLVVTGATKGTSPKVTNVLWVTQDGDDTNDGKSEDRAKRTIESACSVAEAYTTIFVRSGNYVENNPIYVPERVSIIGDNLRRVNLYYKNPTEDYFWVNNACYIAGVSFRGGRMPGFAISYPPLQHPKLPAGKSGAGVISTSPYVQNCTCFNETGGGMKVDGKLAKGLKSMVLDAFTQFNQGGPGIYITNQGYAQLVSIFTICCEVGTWADNGGFCSIGNSNTSFGDIGLLSDGLSPYLYGGVIKEGTAKLRTDTLRVKNIASRPYVGLVATVGQEFSYVKGVNIIDEGIGYTSAPTMLFDSPIGYAKVPATATATVTDGKIVAITVQTSGEGYTGGAFATIYDASGNGAAVSALIYYALDIKYLDNKRGQGYQVDDLIYISGGSFPSLTLDTPCILQVTGVSIGGVVTSATIYDDPNITDSVKTGGEYTVLPIFSGAETTTDGIGVGFSCSINFGIKRVEISDIGFGYTSPQITISGGGAATARAIATWDSVTGTISDTILISQGGGYVPQPVITITGGGGASDGTYGYEIPTGATAVAEVINGSVSKIRITNPGSNFVINPEITFSGGGGAGAAVGQISYQAVNVEVHKLTDNTYSSSYYYGGSGYQVNDLLTVIGGDNVVNGIVVSDPIIVQVVGVTSNSTTSGIVTSVIISNAGTYTSLPPLNGVSTITNGSGTGCLLNLSMGLLEIAVASGGNSYLSGPRVKFIGGDAQSLSFKSGQSYWIYKDNTVTSAIPGEIQATIDAIDYAKGLSLALISASPQSVKDATTAFFDSVTAFINDGVSLSPYDNAYTVIQSNKAFLQAEIGAYMSSAYFSDPDTGLFPTFSMTDAQRAYCIRDVGLIVDAISIDASTGGFVRSMRAGKSYWNGVTSILPAGESLPTQNAIDLIRDWLLKIVNNDDIFTPPTGYGYGSGNYQTSVAPIAPNNSQLNCLKASENITASANVINYIIENSTSTAYNTASDILKNNVESIKNQVIAWLTTNYPSLNYDKSKCGRDIEYIVSGVAGDLIGSGGSPAIAEAILYPKYYTVTVATPLVINSGPIIPPPINEGISFRSGDAYWSGTQPRIIGQAPETIAAINHAKTISGQIIKNLAITPLQSVVTQTIDTITYPDGALALDSLNTFFDHINRFINDLSVPPDDIRAHYAESAMLLTDNKTFLQNEITSYIQVNYSVLWNSFSDFQKAACTKDVGTIIDGMAIDAAKGTIIQAIKSGRGYWNGVTQVIGSSEVDPITDAMGYLKTLCYRLINNQSWSHLPAITLTGPDTSVRRSISTFASDNVNVAFDVLIYVIKNGPIATGWVNASELLRKNKSFIQAEIRQYVINTYGINFLTPRQLALCTRDAGFIVDSVAGDLVADGGEPVAVTSANETGVIFEEFLDYIPLDNETINFYRVSVVTTSSHNFEYVGAGTDINTCLPQFGGVPIQTNETVSRNGGRIYFTSTDHRGDFRIGPGLVINQNSGTLSGRTFEKSLFGIITPFILSIESTG